jgi:hypothetical protein
MLESIFDLPLIITGPAIVGSLCLFAIGGLLFVRRYVLPHLRIDHEDAHFSGAMVHSVMVFYGLALAFDRGERLRDLRRRVEDHFTRGDRLSRAAPGCERLSRADSLPVTEGTA